MKSLHIYVPRKFLTVSEAAEVCAEVGWQRPQGRGTPRSGKGNYVDR